MGRGRVTYLTCAKWENHDFEGLRREGRIKWDDLSKFCKPLIFKAGVAFMVCSPIGAALLIMSHLSANKRYAREMFACVAMDIVPPVQRTIGALHTQGARVSMDGISLWFIAQTCGRTSSLH